MGDDLYAKYAERCARKLGWSEEGNQIFKVVPAAAPDAPNTIYAHSWEHAMTREDDDDLSPG